MATQLEPAKSLAPANKYDRHILRQLAQTSGRVRRLDVLTTVMVLVLAAMAYAVVMLSLDLWLDLPAAARLVSFVVFGLLVLGYLGVRFWSLLFLRVNPYYAARQLEKTLPDAKGSVVNWLDLHDDPLPGAIRNSLSVRAAEDLGHADPDKAVHTSMPYWLLAALGVVFVPLLLLFVAGPRQFTSLLARSFLPFQESTLAPRTEITLLEPRGDATIAEKQSVQFRVKVEGRVPDPNQPDALKLQFRYNKADIFKDQKFAPGDEGEWTASLVSDQIPSSGIYYKISGGDAETPEYFIRVQSAPMVTKFHIAYEPRPYRPWAKKSKENGAFPLIEEYEGTKVSLKIATNRELQAGHLYFHFEEQATVKLIGKLLPNEPDSLLFEFPVEKSGSVTVHFKSKQGEENTDTGSITLIVHKDAVPKVDLKEPALEILHLPANGILQIKGQAEDFDVQHVPPSAGIKKMQVQMKVVKGHPEIMLAPKIYREGKSFELAGKRFPKFLDYQDFVDLAKLKEASGKPFPVKDGMEIEYWLEAWDICDYPDKAGHLAKSLVKKIIILPSEDQKKADEQKKDAEKKQAGHEHNQDQGLKKQSDEITEKIKQEGDGAKGKEGDQLLDDLEKIKKDKDNPGKAKGAGNDDEKNPPGMEPTPPSPDSKPSQEKKGDDSPPKDKSTPTDKGKDQGADPGKGKDQGTDPGKGPGDKGDPQPAAKSGDMKDGGKPGDDGPGKKDQPMPGGPDSKQGAAKDKQGTGEFKPAQDKKTPPPQQDPKENGPAQSKGDPNAGKPKMGDPPMTNPPNPPMGSKPGDDPHKGSAKGPPPEPPPMNAKDSPGGKIKPEEVAKIEDNFKNGDAKQKEKALEELEQLGKQEGKSTEFKEAVKEALEQLKKGSTGKDNPPMGNGMDQNPKGDPASQKPKDGGTGNPTDPKSGPNQSGPNAGNGKPHKAADNKQLGALQLEELKSQLEKFKKLLADPDVKKAMSPQKKIDVENHMKKLEEQIKNEVLPAPGSGYSNIGGKAPGLVNPGGGPSPTIQGGNFARPPEYEQAFKKLTSDPNLNKKSPPGN